MLVFLVLTVLVHLPVFCPYVQALTNIDVTCPPNWAQHPFYKNACYRLGTTAGNFTSASAGCEAFLNGSTVANVYNREIHNFLADGLLTLGQDYYSGLTRQLNGDYVFTELHNEPLGSWDKWGTTPTDICTVYSNVGGQWVWKTTSCDQSCHYICEYIVPTPGQLPLVLFPVDSTPLSGRLEIFMNNMWGGFRDSEPKETVTVVCQDLGYLPDIGNTCTGATCGTGKIWYEKVKCNADSANMSECLDGTKLYTNNDHDKDTIIRCKDITTIPMTTTEHSTTVVDTTAAEDTTTVVDTTTAEDTTVVDTTTAEDTTVVVTTTTEHTTTAEDTTSPQNVVTTNPITPQNNVSVIYHNVTTTVNVTVTESSTVFATTTLWVTSSAACWSSSSIDTTLPSTSLSSSSVSSTSTSTSTTTTKTGLVYETLPVMKSKNSAKYSTKTRQDYRPSAQVIGSFGIFIVVGILAAIVALDLGTLGKEVSRICKKRNRKNGANPNKSDTLLELAKCSSSSSIRSLTNISINTLAKESYVNKDLRD